jgi:predicted permease
VLLVGAALMTRSLMRLQAIDIGLDPSHLVTLQIGLPAPAYSDAGARDAFTADLVSRLRQQPGIQDASAGDLPLRGSMVLFGQFEFSDRPEPVNIGEVLAVFGIWPDYFRTSGIRLLQGHDFSPRDPENPAIVSAGFASKFFGTRSPIGLRFRHAGGTWRTIVGVTSEVHDRSDSGFADEPQVYYPHDRVTDVARVTRLTSTIAEYRTVVVRADSVAAAMTLLPATVHAADPRVVVSKITPVARTFADGVARPRIVFLMMTVFAVFGLVLAGAGLYGVLSCLVAQRMRELGIRIALGARPHDLRQMILGSGLRLTLVGVVGGLALSLALVRVMRSLLYEVDPSDPTSMVLVSALLLTVAVLASWFPARRAMRVDPVTLLRE